MSDVLNKLINNNDLTVLDIIICLSELEDYKKEIYDAYTPISEKILKYIDTFISYLINLKVVIG